MSVTAAQIATYLSDIEDARADYMDTVILKEKLGSHELFGYRAVATILDCYITIVNKYFGEPSYDGSGYFLTSYNFYDEEEIEDVILRINKICDTNYTLDI
jgi:hypothetical protein